MKAKRITSTVFACLALLLMLAALLPVAACADNGDDALPPVSSVDNDIVTFSASIDDPQTRSIVTDNKFTDDAKITISLRQESSKVHTYARGSDGNWTSKEPLRWGGKETLEIVAWHPHTIMDGIPVTIPKNQSNERDFENGCFVLSSVQTLKRSAPKLVFQNLLARIIVRVKADDTVPGREVRRVGLSNVASTSSALNFYSGTIAIAQGSVLDNVTPHPVTPIPAGYLAAYEARVLPQTIKSNSTFLTIGIKNPNSDYNDTFFYSIPAGSDIGKLEGGYTYIYNVTATRLQAAKTSVANLAPQPRTRAVGSREWEIDVTAVAE